MNRRRTDQTAVRISDEEYTRLENKFEALKNEFIACKRKLESKCEALLILSKELDQCRSERDQFKLMAEQLRERHQTMKKQLSGKQTEPIAHQGQKQYSDKQSQNLLKLLYEAKDQNKSIQFELEDTKQKLQDAHGDIKLLREQIARQRVGTTDEGMNTRHFPAHEREELVQKLESSREQYLQLERDLQTVLDEKEEHVTERDVYKVKYERLNQELNYILKGDENRVVDIDGLIMENKFLQDRLKQMVEEKSMAMAAVSKYKSLLEKKKSKSCMKLGQTRGGGMVISQKQVQDVLTSNSSVVPTPQAMSDLQALASALLDTVNDKNLALSHQRKTNKILGNRVAELEKKIKTLEVAGLWNVSGHAGPIHLEKLLQECNEMKTLIPHRVSHHSESDQLSVSDKESELGSVTPLDSCPTSVETSPTHTAQPMDPLQLGDLDLLPTKEVSSRPLHEEHPTESIICEIVKSAAQSDVETTDASSKVSSPEIEDIINRSPEQYAPACDSENEQVTSTFCEEEESDTPSLCDTTDHTVDESEHLEREFVNSVEDEQINDVSTLSNNEAEAEGEDRFHVYNKDKVEDDVRTLSDNDADNEDRFHVYDKDRVEDEEAERDDIDRDLDLDLDDTNNERNKEMQVDFNGGGDATSFYGVKQEKAVHVNGNGYSSVGDNDDEIFDDLDNPESSETIGMLVESMAQKICNISHKRESFDDADGENMNDSSESGKLLQETNDEEGDYKRSEEEPHNVDC